MMANGQSVSTAKWIAAARARESARPDRLFDDPFAAALAGQAGFEMLARSEAASGGENVFLPIRTRYFDDLLARVAADQVVLPGAGMDTRAYRLPLPDGTQVFELDRADVLEEKERILAEAGAVARSARHAIDVDLTDAWTEELLAAGFEPGRRSIWIAEGLLFYLGGDEVRSLLENARSLAATGSVFAADVFGTGLLDQAQMQPRLRFLASAGRPPPFATDDPAGLLASCGWAGAEITEPGDRGGTYGRLPEVGVQRTGVNRAYLIHAQASMGDP